MDIGRAFVAFKKPSQFYYAGTDGLEAYRVTKGKVTQVAAFNGLSLLDLTPSQFGRILEKTGDASEIGIILNSGHFIFNILEFQRLPLRESLKRDLVEWKIKKVFPEEMEQYEHHYFQLSKSRILSVLFKRALKSKIENIFNGTGRSLVFLGNSSIEIINSVFGAKKRPDFFMEMDGDLSLVVFQNRSVPYYIRKFTVEKIDDVIGELSKTLSYVESSFNEKPGTFSLVSNLNDDFLVKIREEMKSRQLGEIAFPGRENLFIPV